MGRATARSAERGIAETLNALDLSEGSDDPETAAAEAAAAVSTQERPDGIIIPPPRDAEEESEDNSADETSQSDEMTPLPSAAPAFVPPPRPARPDKNQRKNKANLGVLAMKAPSADKVKVYKRNEVGELYFVRDYTPADVNRFSDYESFLTRYIEPEHGSGEYELVGVNPANQEMPLGTIRLIHKPRAATAEQGVAALVDKLLMRGEDINKDAIQRMEKTMQEAQASRQDPLTLLNGVLEMTEKLEGKSSNGKQDGNALAIAAMQENTKLMVAMFSQQPRREENPLMQKLLERVLEREMLGGGSSTALPPPPPPPPSSPFAFLEKVDIPATITAIAALAAAFGMGAKKDNSEEKAFERLMQFQRDNSLGMKEVIALLKSDGGQQTDSFTDTLDKMAGVMNLAKNLDPGGSPQNSFMDVLAAFAGNRDLGAGITRLLSAKLGGGAAPLPPGATVLTPQQADKVKSFQAALIQEKKNLAEERRQLEVEKRRLAAVAQGQDPEAAVSEAPAPTPTDTSAAPAAEEKTQENARELPPQTREFLVAMETAADEVAHAKAFVEFLLYFHGDPTFRPFAEAVIRDLREGNKQKALHNLHTLFNVFVAEGHFKKDAAGKTLKLLHTHLEEFQKVFSEVPLDLDAKVTRESLLAPSGEAAAQ